MLNRLKGQYGAGLLLLRLLFDGRSAFGGNVLRIRKGYLLCVGIGGLGKVVLGGAGVGGNENSGVLNVPGIRVGGDLAIGGKIAFDIV